MSYTEINLAPSTPCSLHREPAPQGPPPPGEPGAPGLSPAAGRPALSHWFEGVAFSPLPREVERRMSLFFGADFSTVQIAVRPESALSGARAAAWGDRIVFAAGAYAPDTADGLALIAHELTHVLQHRFDFTGNGAADPGAASLGAGCALHGCASALENDARWVEHHASDFFLTSDFLESGGAGPRFPASLNDIIIARACGHARARPVASICQASPKKRGNFKFYYNKPASQFISRTPQKNNVELYTNLSIGKWTSEYTYYAQSGGACSKADYTIQNWKEDWYSQKKYVVAKLDSEVKALSRMVNYLYRRFPNRFDEFTGQIVLTSDLGPCTPCRSVIKFISNQFPNVDFTVYYSGAQQRSASRFYYATGGQKGEFISTNYGYSTADKEDDLWKVVIKSTES